MKKTARADIVIIGGGIAGLWLLNRLRRSGFSTILIEANALGCGQTHKSQGIIHGGMKYALQGVLSPSAKTISEMPSVWEKCLNGEGEIDLREVRVLSRHQYLWSTGSLNSKLSAFFASKVLHGKIEALQRDNFPGIFQTENFKGHVYRLEEMVLDVHSLLHELAKPHQDVIFKIDALNSSHLHWDSSGNLLSLQTQLGDLTEVELSAQKFIFAAGAGNELLLQKIPAKNLAMQRRPLHMVLVKTNFSEPLFAHCMGTNAVPRITITSHQARDGKTVWYLGGQIAEEGVNRDQQAQIHAAFLELKDLFPWLDFSSAEWASFFIDRAEALQPDGSRPENVFVQSLGNLCIAWPTKLALAPKLSSEILAILAAEKITPQTFNTQPLHSWPMPPIATPIWDELLC